MLPGMRATIARMGQGLPDKRSAANQFRQPAPLSGQVEPDRPLSQTASRNRPAVAASSNEGDKDSGTQSNREGWLGMVWKGRRTLPFRCHSSDGDAVGGAPCPRRDRTQISEAPQAIESLHKRALRGAQLRLTSVGLLLARSASFGGTLASQSSAFPTSPRQSYRIAVRPLSAHRVKYYYITNIMRHKSAGAELDCRPVGP